MFNGIGLCLPADIAGGYICFVVSIFGIGVVTAVIGDVASYFGCTLGIKDSVTAILFVALGTSIPGEFLLLLLLLLIYFTGILARTCLTARDVLHVKMGAMTSLILGANE